MIDFATLHLNDAPRVSAPDGATVHVLLALRGGSMAQFSLAAGQVSRAVTHRTVEEIWIVTQGRGQIWRRQGTRDEIVTLEPGVCLTLPLGTAFQFRAADDGDGLSALAVTLPPWPGSDEAVPANGPWPATAG